MGLLFLSGDWWEGGGGLEPGVRSRDPGWEAGLLEAGINVWGGQASLGRSPPPECPEEPPVTTSSTLRLPSCSGTTDLWSSDHGVLLDSFRLKTRLPVLHLFHP